MTMDFIEVESLLSRAVENLKHSPLGTRIACSDVEFRAMLWQGSCIWSMVDTFASELKKPAVRIVNPHFPSIPDSAYWMDPKIAGLPQYGSLEILNVPPHDTSSFFSKSPFAQWVDHYPKPRVRNTSKAELITQIQRSSLTILFDLDLIDHEDDFHWISELREGQLLVPALRLSSVLPSLVRLINAGAVFSERIFTVNDPDGEPTHFPVYSFSSFSKPISPPIPLPNLNEKFGGDNHLRIRPARGRSLPALSISISPTHDITEDGEVVAVSETPTRTTFDIGPFHSVLPRAARFAHAIASGTTTSQLAFQGVPIAVPPLLTSMTQEAVIRATIQVIRKRGPGNHAAPRDEHGRGLLSQAVLTGAPARAIADLINCGVDPDDVDNFGWPATAYAAALNRSEIVNELVLGAFADLQLEVAPGVTVDDIINLYKIRIESPDSESEVHDDSELSPESESEPSVAPPSGTISTQGSAPPNTFSVGASAQSIALIPPSEKFGSQPITSVSRRPLSESLSSILSQISRQQGDADSSRLPTTLGPIKPFSQEDFANLLPSVPSTSVRASIEAVLPDPQRTSRTLSEVEPIFATVVDIPSRIEAGEIRAAIHTWIAQTSTELNAIDPTLPRFDSTRFSVLSDEDPRTGLFALRFDNHVPQGLTFRTEFVVFPTETATIVSTRLQAIRPPGNEDNVEPSVPRIVASFAELGARHRNLPIGKPLPVSTEADADLLASIIFDQSRVVPLLVVYGTTEYVLTALPPAVRAALLIVYVAPAAIPLVQRRIGRDFIGFKGAWRIYPPGLKPDSSRYDAPLILDPASIAPSRLANQFRHTIWRLTRSLTEDDCPTYLAARQLILQRQRDNQSRLDAIQQAPGTLPQPLANSVNDEQVETSQLADAVIADASIEKTHLPEAYGELAELQSQVKGLLASIAELHARVDQSTRQHRDELQRVMEETQLWKHLAEDADAKVSALITERDQAKREAFDLRTQLSFLTGGALSITDDSSSSREYPNSFDALADWVDANYEGRIMITKKALKAANSVRSEPHIIAKVYESLDLLANEYLESKQGDPQARERYLERQARTKLSVTPVGEAVNNHRYAAEYSATVGSRRYTLDMHVKELGGTDFNPERQLRVYFCYDEANGRVVIGHLPTHLTSSHS